MVSFLRRRASKRWNKRNLNALLEPQEQLLWPDVAFSGILGIPWIRRMPFIWGSTLWDVALTDKRFLAVQFRFLPIFRRTVLSVSWPEVAEAELRIYTGIRAVILRIKGLGLDEEFKLRYAAADYAGIEDTLRKHVPGLRTKKGMFRAKASDSASRLPPPPSY